MTAKIATCVQEAVPAIKLAVEYEYAFVGEIMRSEYITTMTELNISTRIDDIPMKMIARKYKCEDTVFYSSGIEL
ncbi:hypothetical protein FOPE_10934 [Fonsecaea pedrosoi]|nr:hypothetical protein FOPE_10934 [Fonsecaea pedrosoi]